MDPGATRRGFLKGVAGSALVAATTSPLAHAAPKPMPTKAFGKTGRKVSRFGLGCFPLGKLAGDKEGIQVLHRALQAGCTYLDTAPSYANGKSERRVGLALRDWDKPVFLATKTHTRTAGDAARDLDASLKRLRVSKIDLVQVHAVSDREDLVRALDIKKGPLKTLLKAKADGVIGHIGVTGHADPDVMRQTFEQFPFESILMPLNCVDPHRLSFIERTLPAAVKKGIARIAMKVFASGKLPPLGVDAGRCLRFTYALDVSTTIVGCRTVAEVDLAARMAREGAPLSPEERKALVAQTRPHSGRPVEWYKRA